MRLLDRKIPCKKFLKRNIFHLVISGYLITKKLKMNQWTQLINLKYNEIYIDENSLILFINGWKWILYKKQNKLTKQAVFFLKDKEDAEFQAPFFIGKNSIKSHVSKFQNEKFTSKVLNLPIKISISDAVEVISDLGNF